MSTKVDRAKGSVADLVTQGGILRPGEDAFCDRSALVPTRIAAILYRKTSSESGENSGGAPQNPNSVQPPRGVNRNIVWFMPFPAPLSVELSTQTAMPPPAGWALDASRIWRGAPGSTPCSGLAGCFCGGPQKHQGQRSHQGPPRLAPEIHHSRPKARV